MLASMAPGAPGAPGSLGLEDQHKQLSASSGLSWEEEEAASGGISLGIWGFPALKPRPPCGPQTLSASASLSLSLF